MRLVKAALASGLLVAAAFGCGGSRVALAPMSATYTISPAARVDLTNIQDDIYTLMVYNTSGGGLVIDRDAFLLQTPAGLIKREPGGLASVYNVPPGGAHDVRLRFRVEGLPAGQQVYLLVDQAVRVNGEPVGLPPIVLQAH